MVYSLTRQASDFRISIGKMLKVKKLARKKRGFAENITISINGTDF